MSDLKPCPFCGGEIGFDFEHDNFLCSGCWAIMPYSPNGETVNTRPIEDKLKAEIDRLQAERRWIPIDKVEPPVDRVFLVYGKGQVLRAGNIQNLPAVSFLDVTHWMPLPAEPPSEEEC